MPYEIKHMKDDDRWCVHKEGGELVKCHDSEEKAKAHLRALYANVHAVKAVGDWEIEVRAVPFGTDADKQSFDNQTDFMLENFPTPAIVYHHGVKTDRKGYESTPVIIGKTISVEKRGDGIWLRVILDKLNEYASKVWEAAKAGLAVASSDSIAHLARLEVGGKRIPYQKQPGRIAVWPLAAVSLWDAGNSQLRPASPLALAMPALKTIYEQAGLSLPDIGGEQPQALEKSAAKNEAEPNKESEMDDKKEVGLTDEQVQAKIDNALKAQAEASEAAQKAAQERQAEIDAEVAKQVEAVKAEAAKARRLPFGEAPYQAEFADTWKFDNLSPGEIGMVIDIQEKSPKGKPSQQAYKALALRIADAKVEPNEEALSMGYVKGALKAAAGFDPTVDAIKAATDPMYSTLSGAGSQWVGTAYSRELWQVIRANANVAARIPDTVVPDGFSSKYFPLESTNPTWYKVAETTGADATSLVPVATVPASQAVTANKQITLAKMGCRVMYTGELVEDSLIAFVPELRRELAVTGQEMMDHVCIDGDTVVTASTNINGNDTTPTTQVYLIANGFRKLALYGASSANARDGGALDEDDYLETMFKMGTAGLGAADLQKCSFIVDPNVYKASLKLSSLKTKDVWANATLESGVLTKLWGYEVIPSWFMHYASAKRMTGAAGTIDGNTDTNNTKGAILGVRWDQWKLAYKRRMTMEVTRFANSDSWEIVALARWGLAYRDDEAAAISYNLTV